MQVKQIDLFAPSLNELVSVFQTGLASFFSSVSVGVKPCPNLCEAPFFLTSPGLAGRESVVDIGGVKNLLPLPNLSKTYSISNVLEQSEFGRPSFVIGAGAGPFHLTNKNCELVADCSQYKTGALASKNRLVSLDDKDEKSGVTLGENDECGLMLNLYASQGDAGEVLEIICEHRLDESLSDDDNFANRIRKILLKHYGEKPIGIGGVILFETGKARLHVMPGFSQTPLDSVSVNSWLRFFEVDAPLVAVGELVSYDPGLNLRTEHFHCFKPGSLTDGGHFHTDTTPKTARYRAYFNVAKRLIRVDQP